jgi:hypothetical protein
MRSGKDTQGDMKPMSGGDVALGNVSKDSCIAQPSPPSQAAIEARELIKRSCTVPNANGECYIPADETIDMIA